jgi:alkanesulfonate monooxygenase SsuD/methylene tetrahydromethanopterin reductase-like flavin-dependent oxidoreductase (luciferase family)
VAFGIGTSSNVIVERWNDIAFEEPYKRTRDMVRFLRTALTGEKVKADYDTFSVNGFRLSAVPEQQPKILIAALRQGMLRLAGKPRATAPSSTGSPPTTCPP